MTKSKLLKISATAMFLLAMQAAVPALSSSATADDGTDFVCWDLDDGGVECEDYDLIVMECEGNEDVYPCDSIDQDEAKLDNRQLFNPRGNFALPSQPALQMFVLSR